MTKHIRILAVLLVLFTLIAITPASGQAPPPPSHSQNGNQASPGGTGCPLDRTGGMIMILVLGLGYAGFFLYKTGKEKKELM